MTEQSYKDSQLYLDAMVEAIERIQQYSEGKVLSDYENNSEMSDAIHMRLQILGESVNKLSIEFRDAHPNIPWLEMRALRNVITHDYAAVKPERIWQTIQKDLPVLLQQIKKIAGELENN